LEHLHLGIDEQRHHALDVTAEHCLAATQHGVYQTFRRQEFAHGVEVAKLGHRIGVLMRVGHTRIEGETLPRLRVGANAIGDLLDRIVRGAHKTASARLERGLENVDDVVDVLKAHRLLASLFLRHVIDAEELVIAKKNPFHSLGPLGSGSYAVEKVAHPGDEFGGRLV